MSQSGPDIAMNPTSLAATWLARRSAGLNDEGEAQFRAWISADPANRRAWEEATRIWALAGAGEAHPDIIRLRADALAAGPLPKPSRLPIWAAAAAAFVGIVGASWMLWPVGTAPPAAIATVGPRVLSTGVGERSTYTLPDGTAVTLNTRSRAEVHFAGNRRGVTLLAGQALFQVAKDPSRPFVVRAGDREITAVGTEFDVRIFAGDVVRVALVEGKVKVAKIAPVPGHQDPGSMPVPTPVAELEPGEQLVSSADRPTSVRPMDMAKLTSWREGRVVFADTRLVDAVGEINRYTSKPIHVADAKLHQLRISGTFRTGQPQGFVTAITEYFPVTATDEGDRVELHSSR